MAAFDKAWKLAKEIKETLDFIPTEQWETKKNDPLGDALDSARAKKREPLDLPGYVRSGSAPRGSRVPRRKFKTRDKPPPGYRDPPPSAMDMNAHMMPVPKPKRKPSELSDEMKESLAQTYEEMGDKE